MATMKTFDGVESVRSDSVRINPDFICVEEGFNRRTDWGDIESLADEIKAQGVLAPLTLRTKKDDPSKSLWLVNGGRRYKAIQLLKERGIIIKEVPAEIRKNMSDEDALKAQYTLNDGKEFTQYEKGLIFKEFVQWGYKQAQIATQFGCSQATIAQCLSLLDSPPEVKAALSKNEINANQARKVMKTAQGNAEKAKEALEKVKKKEKITQTPKTKNVSRMFDSWKLAGRPTSADMLGYSKLATENPEAGEGRAFNAGRSAAYAELLRLTPEDIPGYLMEETKKSK